MKKELNAFERLYKAIAPESFLSRKKAELTLELLEKTRSYEAQKTLPSAKKKATNVDNNFKDAGDPLRNAARNAYANAPLAKKGVQIISNGVISYGINPQFSHPKEADLVKIDALWKQWSAGELTFDNSDFASLQHQVMEAVVMDGELLLRKVVIEGTIKFQILEADYICTTKPAEQFDEKFTFVNGIVVDEYRRPKFYHLYDQHPVDAKKKTTKLVPADQIIHVFKKERQGLRGVTWFYSVIESLNLLNELQYTNLLRQKLGASITAVVTTQSSGLNPELLEKERQQMWELSAGSVQYINPDEKIEFPSIPNPEGFSESMKQALREVAAGLGVTYEALSGDLSLVNFSSGRMGDLQFRANITQWQYTLIIPKLLNPIFENFKLYCQLKGISSAKDLTVQWIVPARQMLDPEKEVKATQAAIRAGLMSYTEALTELGYNANEKIKEIKESNDLLDANNIVLDSDPRRTGNQNLQDAAKLPTNKE